MIWETIPYRDNAVEEEESKPILFSIMNGLHSEIMLTQIKLVMTILKIVSNCKSQRL